jgi:hypothetical protein
MKNGANRPVFLLFIPIRARNSALRLQLAASFRLHRKPSILEYDLM